MAKNTKRSFRVYAAWNYEQEIEDLNRASEQGWQLVKGGLFHSKFVKKPELRYRYQLDYRQVEDMGRYLETYREQGWEYVNSTFNGWHFFRKLYDPALPEEAYEIFTDRESLQEMNSRWSRLALTIGILLFGLAVPYGMRAFGQPSLVSWIQFLPFLIEGAVLLRGWSVMRKPSAPRSRRGGSAWFSVFLVVILLGLVGSLTLVALRPSFTSDQRTDSVSEPIVDHRWMDFEVRYPDNYYLDLEMEAEQPMTFAIIDANGETVYSVTDTSFHGDNIRLPLARGQYWLSLSCDSGYQLNCSFN